MSKGRKLGGVCRSHDQQFDVSSSRLECKAVSVERSIGMEGSLCDSECFFLSSLEYLVLLKCKPLT